VTGISYGKLSVPVQCVNGADLLALDVSMEVLGQGFLAAYTEGDNRGVVATDTMKNVILRHALEHDGTNPEGFLEALGRRFLTSYPEMERLRLWAEEQPFAPVSIGGEPSDRLFALGGPDHAVAELELDRDGLIAARSGHVGMRLLKTTGSAFTRFARDAATTLPERSDRPLYIALDVHWRYADPADALGRDPDRYVAAAQVRDLVATVFHEFVSESIQHLVHEMGQRILARFPALSEVSFRGENHTHDPVPGMEPDADRKAYTSAFPAWGLITLTLTR
jgi:urate oxidase / 2-oxo-4-hydroxy-4-carboxy-5-ureidoimidazoline decarboxylase